MTFEELQEMQDDVLEKIWMLSSENDIYERYLTRTDPQIMKGITQLLDRTKHTRRLTHMMSMRSSRMSFRDSIMTIPDVLRRKTISSRPSTPSMISIMSGSRMVAPGVFPTWKPTDSSKLGNTSRVSSKIIRITIAHRVTMANKEVGQMRKNLNELKTNVKKRTANIRAEIEELEIRISEAREAKEEFEENVVIGGVDAITGKIPGERVTRFVEEWLRSANTIIGRLRLKSATLRTLIKKTRQQLVQREELGEALRAVDFEQLNIQNKDYVRMIEEKTIYVIDMKRIAGHYHLKLTQHKQKLSDLLSTLSNLKKEISQRDQQIEELRVEGKHVEKDVARMNEELGSLLNYMEHHSVRCRSFHLLLTLITRSYIPLCACILKVPDILDFVNLQAEVQELQKEYKLLNRRKNIERIIFRTSQKQAQSRPSESDLQFARHKRKSGTIFPVAPLHLLS
ncbi:uncharacterized protein LOC116424875 [Nomia melanderi]|uniref:uncharacterized protein LOC116424875 n=1 Tax=Nomia melanderi TaxID=2448451 RepID=UPI003FCE4693